MAQSTQRLLWRFFLILLLLEPLAACNDTPEDDDDDDNTVTTTLTPPPSISHPHLVLGTSELNFGEVDVGASETISFTISNEGEAILTVDSITLEDANASGAFALTPEGPYSEMEGGDTLTLSIEFAPQSGGIYLATLRINSNDEDSPHSIALSGEGVNDPSLVDEDEDGVAQAMDCNDQDATIYPGAEEIPYDGIDQNCSGSDLVDADFDGYDAEAANGDDCDDNDANSFPGATEFADGKDNDCDGFVDEELDTVDDDGDGYSEHTGDCNDEDDSVYPGAEETPYDGIDQDCSSLDLTDVDGDGSSAQEAGGADCDDHNADIYPNATEVCNGQDDNCDTLIDEDVTSTFYQDADQDTYGNPEVAVVDCNAPDDFVLDNGDCDDGSAEVSPAAAEVCNGIDDNCDGLTDPEMTLTFYQDLDGDTFGDAGAAVEECSAPEGYVADNTDCDDTQASVNPSAEELCNEIDDNCNEEINEGLEETYYQDSDGDGYGNSDEALLSCDPGEGFVKDATDCDDTRAEVNPAAAEIPYDGLDNDCSDGDMVDVDGDGFVAVQAEGDDCDDNNANTFPGATEIDDDLDNDCDEEIDEELNTTDDDGDGFSEADGDCDDSDPDRYPTATEVCNSTDDDCDGIVDEEVLTTWYRDADGDYYGAASISKVACTAPSGYVEDSTDCDDTQSDVNPGATEVCNNRDDNCDGVIDEEVKAVYYRDVDGDGYGVSSYQIEACSATEGYSPLAGDCDDTRSSVNPGATEICNYIDDDCDTFVDEDVSTTYYRDGDSDGFGSDVSVEACTAPAGYVTDTGDCDDTRANVHPGNDEVCDELDNDCSGEVDEGVTTTYYQDDDGDGFGTVLETTEACAVPAGYSAASTDCNDYDPQIYPGAPEGCNGVDDDCDMYIDEGATVTYYQDSDGDGFGNAEVNDTTCGAPEGYVQDNTDCDDTDAEVNPEAEEVCDGIDNNCNDDIDGPDAADGTTWYYDGDSDGYGSGVVSITSCEAPEGFVDNSVDCDDSYVWGLEEVCDGKDNDCDGNPDLWGGYPATRVGYYGRDIATGDWNGDGHMDIAVANYYSASVSVLYFTGGGTFQVRQNVSTGSGPISITAGDWDQDGDTDMAVSTHASYVVTILENDGTGLFSSSHLSLGFQPMGITSGDWDRDGDRDLAITNYSGSGVTLLINNGGSFSVGSMTVTSAKPWDLSAGDWDGDGDLDLAVSNYDADAVSILRNSGTGLFVLYATATVGDAPAGIISADFNGDSKTDLAVGNVNGNSVTVLQGSGNGIFSPTSTLSVGANPYQLAAGDWDGDGDIDLASANYSSNTVSILRNSGSGSFVVAETAGTSYQAIAIESEDYDEDGDLDLATVGYAGGSANATLHVLRNDGAGSFNAPGAIDIPGNPYGAVVADFNDDGIDDLAVNNYTLHSTSIYLQDEEGGLTLMSTPSVLYYPYNLTAGDLDGDGDIDLVVSTNHDYARLYILLNDGSGVMTPSYYQVSGRTYGVAIGDWDRDGDSDIAYTVFYSNGANSNQVGFLKNDGDASFEDNGTVTVGTYPQGMVSGDWDSDGDLDLAVANSSSSTISILKNNGSGAFAQVATLSAGSSPRNLIAEDLDMDGFVDLVAVLYGSHSIGYYRNNTTGSFQSPITLQTGNYPYDITSLDLDSDGDPDLAVSNVGQGTVSLVMNDGAGVLTETSYIGVAGAAYFINTMRVGATSTESIVTTHYYTNQVTFLTAECD